MLEGDGYAKESGREVGRGWGVKPNGSTRSHFELRGTEERRLGVDQTSGRIITRKRGQTKGRIVSNLLKRDRERGCKVFSWPSKFGYM